MKKLSTGHNSNLGTWRDLAVASFGADSPAVRYMEERISEYGAETEVPMEEQEMFMHLALIDGLEREDEGPAKH